MPQLKEAAEPHALIYRMFTNPTWYRSDGVGIHRSSEALQNNPLLKECIPFEPFQDFTKALRGLLGDQKAPPASHFLSQDGFDFLHRYRAASDEAIYDLSPFMNLNQQYLDILGLNGILHGLNTLLMNTTAQRYSLTHHTAAWAAELCLSRKVDFKYAWDILTRALDLENNFTHNTIRTFGGHRHGFIWAAMGRCPTCSPEQSWELVCHLAGANMCEPSYRTYQMVTFHMGHGVGHGALILAIMKHRNIPFAAKNPLVMNRFTISDAELEDALALCESGPSVEMRNVCAGGLFHAYADLANPEQLVDWYPTCHRVRYPAQCARYVVPVNQAMSLCRYPGVSERINKGCISGVCWYFYQLNGVPETHFRQQLTTINGKPEIEYHPTSDGIEIHLHGVKLPQKMQPNTTGYLAFWCSQFVAPKASALTSTERDRLLACVHSSLYLHIPDAIGRSNVPISTVHVFCSQLQEVWPMGGQLVDECIRTLLVFSSATRSVMFKDVYLTEPWIYE